MSLGTDQVPPLGRLVSPDDDNLALEGPVPSKLDGLAESVALVHNRIREVIDAICDQIANAHQ